MSWRAVPVIRPPRTARPIGGKHVAAGLDILIECAAATRAGLNELGRIGWHEALARVGAHPRAHALMLDDGDAGLGSLVPDPLPQFRHRCDDAVAPRRRRERIIIGQARRLGEIELLQNDEPRAGDDFPRLDG